MSSPTRIFKIDRRLQREIRRFRRDSTTPAISPARFDDSDDVDVRRDLAKTTSSNEQNNLSSRTRNKGYDDRNMFYMWRMETNKWNSLGFIVDDQRGSSLRMIHEDISYNDLIVAVLEDFGIDGNRNSGNLSYASPSKLNFGTKELPLVFIRNDRQVTSYLNKLKENGDLHLCVTIKSRGEVFINHDLPIAGNSNPLERETQISPMIVSNMVQTQDEVLITNDLPIADKNTKITIDYVKHDSDTR
ncbi:hypothetical protein DY000_02039192 [Brassica cretica]|uniref:Uncharacterized protein n=1 Tax=Brassica cretica TaxID=69181 RepID=A0ABQ7BC04_BRACR|nr:hypothetical protein DY000_02039192 [Brassica cretica]